MERERVSDDGDGGDNWSYKTRKAPVKSPPSTKMLCLSDAKRGMGSVCVYIITNDVVLENVAVMLTAVLTVKMLQYCHGDCEK